MWGWEENGDNKEPNRWTIILVKISNCVCQCGRLRGIIQLYPCTSPPPSHFLNSRWENTEQIKHINNQQSYFSQLTRTHISIYCYGSSRAEIRMRSTYYLRKFELPSSVESKYKSHHHSLLTSRETSGLPSVPSFLATFFKKFFQTSKSLVKLYAQ